MLQQMVLLTLQSHSNYLCPLLSASCIIAMNMFSLKTKVFQVIL